MTQTHTFELCPSTVAESGCSPLPIPLWLFSFSLWICGNAWKNPNVLFVAKVICNTYSKKKKRKKESRRFLGQWHYFVQHCNDGPTSWYVCPSLQPEHRWEWRLMWRLDSGWSGRGGAEPGSVCTCRAWTRMGPGHNSTLSFAVNLKLLYKAKSVFKRGNKWI